MAMDRRDVSCPYKAYSQSNYKRIKMKTEIDESSYRTVRGRVAMDRRDVSRPYKDYSRRTINRMKNRMAMDRRDVSCPYKVYS